MQTYTYFFHLNNNLLHTHTFGTGTSDPGHMTPTFGTGTSDTGHMTPT